MQELRGRVAVVTGGASGIGFSLASALAAEGAQVVLGDIEAPALEEAVGKLEASGAEVIGVRTDVSDGAQVEALADAALARFGAVHVLCNNAGVGAGGLSWEADLSTWEWVFGANLWGVIHGLRAFVPILMQQPEAHVVNTASLAGLVGGPFMAPYNASKHAVVAISETLYHEMAMMAPHVHVSVLCPGWVRTRIADSVRNRPDAEAAGEPGAANMFASAITPLIDNGMPPDEVAAKVLAAIRAERFWILPHDTEESWVRFVNERTQSLLDRTDPVLRTPF